MKKIDDEIEMPLMAYNNILRYLSSEHEIEAKKLYIEPLKKDYPEEDIEKWCAAVYKQMLMLKIGNKMINEMLKLRELLDQEEINWCDRSDEIISRTHFEYKGYKWSVVNSLGTYGGYYFDKKNNKNLLELMSAAVNGNEPIGFLTADECIEIIKNAKAN